MLQAAAAWQSPPYEAFGTTWPGTVIHRWELVIPTIIREPVSLLRKCHTCFFLSFLRKQESSEVKGFWTPASAGVTAFL